MLESNKDEEKVEYYKKAEDHASMVRVKCFLGVNLTP